MPHYTKIIIEDININFGNKWPDINHFISIAIKKYKHV